MIVSIYVIYPLYIFVSFKLTFYTLSCNILASHVEGYVKYLCRNIITQLCQYYVCEKNNQWERTGKCFQLFIHKNITASLQKVFHLPLQKSCGRKKNGLKDVLVSLILVVWNKDKILLILLSIVFEGRNSRKWRLQGLHARRRTRRRYRRMITSRKR